MKQLISILLLLLSGTFVFAQQGKRYVKKGNDLYQQKKYKEAEENYRKSVEKKKDTEDKNGHVEGNFNLGDALFKQKKYEEAGTQFSQIAAATNNKAIASQAYHNLGNSFVENKKLEEGIAAYKKALINNPKDEETRYNLAYAQEMLKKQQQKDKQNQQNKNNKDQNKDQQNKDNKDDKNKDDKNKDQNKDKKDQDKQNQNKDDKKESQKPQPDKLSKEDAERMLDALNNQEKQTQDKLKNKKFKGVKARISKDW